MKITKHGYWNLRQNGQDMNNRIYRHTVIVEGLQLEKLDIDPKLTEAEISKVFGSPVVLSFVYLNEVSIIFTLETEVKNGTCENPEVIAARMVRYHLNHLFTVKSLG